jgi:hypothetical protein
MGTIILTLALCGNVPRFEGLHTGDTVTIEVAEQGVIRYYTGRVISVNKNRLRPYHVKFTVWEWDNFWGFHRETFVYQWVHELEIERQPSVPDICDCCR